MPTPSKSTILGPDGRPMERRPLATEQAGPTVTGVRTILSGHPAAGLTPERLARTLRAAEDGDATAYLELAEDMEERDLHYRAVLQTRKLQVSQLDITVEAHSDAPEDQEAADLVRELLDADTLPDTLYDLLDGLGKGYAVCEIMWKLDGARWLPERFEARDPRWFQFDRTDGRTLRLVDGSADGAELASNKFLIHQPRTKSGLPIRGGLARAAAWAFLFKNYALKDWVVFAEVYGHPLRLGKFGPNASEADKDILLEAVRNLGTDAAAIIPQSMLIELVSTSVNGIDLWEKLCNYLDRQVSKAVLGQTATTDAIAGGHAVGREHRQVQEDIERADARQIAGTLNRQLVAPLVAFNLGPRPAGAYPRIRIGRPAEEDVAALVDNVVKLVPLGLRVEASVMADRLGLPDAPADAVLLSAPGAAAPAPGTTPPAPPPRPGTAAAPAAAMGAAAMAVADAAGDAIDRLVDSMLADWEPLMAPVAERIARAADEAKGDPAAFLEALAAIARDGAAPQLVELLARGAFAATVAGRVGMDVHG